MSASDATLWRKVPMMASGTSSQWTRRCLGPQFRVRQPHCSSAGMRHVLFPPSQRTKVWRFNHMAWGWKCFETSISSNAWKPLKIGRQINLLCRTGWCCVPAAVDTRISTQPSWTKAKFRKTSGTRLACRDQAPSLRSSLALVDLYKSPLFTPADQMNITAMDTKHHHFCWKNMSHCCFPGRPDCAWNWVWQHARGGLQLS